MEVVPVQEHADELDVGIRRMILGGVGMHVLLELNVVARLAAPSPSLSLPTSCPGVLRGGLHIV